MTDESLSGQPEQSMAAGIQESVVFQKNARTFLERKRCCLAAAIIPMENPYCSCKLAGPSSSASGEPPFVCEGGGTSGDQRDGVAGRWDRGLVTSSVPRAVR